MSGEEYILHSYNIKHYYMSWHSSKFSIVDEIITEIIDAPKKEYNVLKATKQEEGLIYLDFVNNSGEHHDILKFCNKFGLLYEDIPHAFKSPFDGTNISTRSYSDDAPLPIRLSVKNFLKEQQRFRYIVELYSCLHHMDPNNIELTDLDNLLIAYDRFITKYKGIKLSTTSYMKLELVKSQRYDNQHTLESISSIIMSIVLSEVKKYVDKISVNIIPEVKQRTLTFKGTLLSAMYFRFYLDILTNVVGRGVDKSEDKRVPIRLCLNSEKCNNLFITYYRFKQLYCCPKCGHAHRTRETRRNNKSSLNIESL